MAGVYLVSGDEMRQMMTCMRMSTGVGDLAFIALREEIRASELFRIVESRYRKTDASIDGCVLGATSKFSTAMMKGEEDILYIDLF